MVIVLQTMVRLLQNDYQREVGGFAALYWSLLIVAPLWLLRQLGRRDAAPAGAAENSLNLLAVLAGLVGTATITIGWTYSGFAVQALAACAFAAALILSWQSAGRAGSGLNPAALKR